MSCDKCGGSGKVKTEFPEGYPSHYKIGYEWEECQCKKEE